MLELADLRSGELVVDLGCGDGRIVITAAHEYAARGYGVEIDPRLVAVARRRAAGLPVRIVRADLFTHPIPRNTDVLALYLTRSALRRLRSTFEAVLRPGTRIVSHGFPIPRWTPVHVERFTHPGLKRHHRIFLYRIPDSL